MEDKTVLPLNIMYDVDDLKDMQVLSYKPKCPLLQQDAMEKGETKAH